MKAKKCKFFNLANVLTVAKGFVPFLIFFYPMSRWLVVIALIAMCALDMVDGKLARLTGTASPFGRALDIISDKIAMLCFYVYAMDFLILPHFSSHSAEYDSLPIELWFCPILVEFAGFLPLFLWVSKRRQHFLVEKPLFHILFEDVTLKSRFGCLKNGLYLVCFLVLLLDQQWSLFVSSLILTFGASLETELSNRQRDKTIFLGR